MTDAAPLADASKPDYKKRQVDALRERLLRFSGRAVEILEELSETAENERVRLAAVESILDRSGLGRSQSQEITVSQAEHDIAKTDAELLVARIQENQRAALEGRKEISTEAIIIHEGEVVEVLAGS